MLIRFAKFILPIVFLSVLMPNIALGGVNKTMDALKETVAEIKDSGKPNDSAYKDIMKKWDDMEGRYWKMARHEVYSEASKMFDQMISYGTSINVKITKPSWLH